MIRKLKRRMKQRRKHWTARGFGYWNWMYVARLDESYRRHV